MYATKKQNPLIASENFNQEINGKQVGLYTLKNEGYNVWGKFIREKYDELIN